MNRLLRHLCLATSCCALLLTLSCKKAPSAGEAFITLQSGQTIPLADIEINFYDAGFSSSFASFKTSLVSETRKDFIEKLTEEISKSKEELKDIKDSSSSLEERIKEQTLRDIGNERQQLQETTESLRKQLLQTDPLINELNAKLADHLNVERGIASKIDQIQGNAHEIGVDLMSEINRTIVSGEIATPKLDPDLAKPAQVEPRSLAAMVCSYSKIPSGLRGISAWISASLSGFVNLSIGQGRFIFKITERANYGEPGEFDEGFVSANISDKLSSSAIAPEIRRVFELLQIMENEIAALDAQSETNEDLFDKNLQIWANAKGITTDSIEEQLSKRSDLEASISENQGALQTLREDSEASQQRILAAVQESREDLSNTITQLQKRISEYEDHISRVSASRDASELDVQGLTILEGKIQSFFKSEKMNSTRTGSDGKFAVPPKARYVSALVRRELQEEELFWLIKIDLDDLEVKIMNSNLTRQSEGYSVLAAMETEIE